MTAGPEVIGLVLNYRDASRTLRCVTSILEQGAAQVMIWDNSEDSGVSARELIQMLANESRVWVHISESNVGFAAGVNQGMERIRERFADAWVLLLNNDAYLLPGAITPLKDALTEKPNAAISYPDIDHGGRILGTVYYHRLTGLLTRWPLPGSFPYASGCCQLIAPQRSKANLFDEDFFMYGEDWEQGHSLGKERMAHVAQPIVYHEGSRSSGLGSDFYESHIVAAHWLLAHKTARSHPDLLLLMGLRFITLSARAVLRALRYRSLVPVKALLGSLYPSAMRH